MPVEDSTDNPCYKDQVRGDAMSSKKDVRNEAVREANAFATKTAQDAKPSKRHEYPNEYEYDSKPVVQQCYKSPNYKDQVGSCLAAAVASIHQHELKDNFTAEFKPGSERIQQSPNYKDQVRRDLPANSGNNCNERGQPDKDESESKSEPRGSETIQPSPNHKDQVGRERPFTSANNRLGEQQYDIESLNPLNSDIKETGFEVDAEVYNVNDFSLVPAEKIGNGDNSCCKKIVCRFSIFFMVFVVALIGVLVPTLLRRSGSGQQVVVVDYNAETSAPAYLIYEPLRSGSELRFAISDYFGSNDFASKRYGPKLGNWNVSSVRDFSSAFENMKAFNESIESWDVSKATSMRRMFKDASLFHSDISTWHVSQVANMDEMFYGASSFSSDLSNWRVDSVTSMRAMFKDASEFQSDISGWNVGQVRDMKKMFFNASSFQHNLCPWRSLLCLRYSASAYDFVNKVSNDIGSFTIDMFVGTKCPITDRPVCIQELFCHDCPSN